MKTSHLLRHLYFVYLVLERFVVGKSNKRIKKIKYIKELTEGVWRIKQIKTKICAQRSYWEIDEVN